MHYRLYALDGPNGRIISGQDVLADSDDAAIQAAHGIYPDTPFEIWCRARRVSIAAAGEESAA
jgi:hypothetical protein